MRDVIALYFSCAAVSHIWAFMYLIYLIWIIFVANSIEIVGKGDIGTTPLTYLDNNDDFPTPMSPNKITIYFLYIFYFYISDHF